MTTGSVVAVTGATGRQGGAVTRHLLSQGWRVRALTRAPDGAPARRLRTLGADVVRADMTEPDSLIRAFRGAHGVFSVQNPMTSGVEAEVAQGTNVADAAKDADVQHLVYASAGVGLPGTGVGSWESKLRVETHIASLDLPTTVLRPMALMELMTDRAFYPAVSTWYTMPRLMGADRPVWWVCVDDVGAIAARAFAEPGRFVGTAVKIAADVRSIAQCRADWRAAMGRAPRRAPMPTWMFERFVGTDVTTMWRWLATGSVDVDPAETREILPGAVTVPQWLARRRVPARANASR